MTTVDPDVADDDPEGRVGTGIGPTGTAGAAEEGTDDGLSVAPGAAPARRPRTSLRWWREVVYIFVVYVAYSAVRNQFGSGAGTSVDADPAFHHAEAIIQVERNLHLYFEDRLQQWYLDLPLDGLIRVWNVYYGIFHFVVAAFALVYLYRKAPERYRVWRNTLAFTTVLALVGFATFSLMPPRLLDDPGVYGGCTHHTGLDADALPDAAGEAPCDGFGYVDTVATYGGWASFGSEEMAAVSNQYAAMPSMHIGWSTWCAFVLAPLIRRRWLRALAIAYPLVTLFDIMVTANHYWIDGLGGLACLGAGYLIARALTRAWEARRGTVTGARPAVA
ncbi:MAG TPA: phosphatase PAP2 family protein [Acidimicrobiales bacterium]|nr:phosphatase PAP2 family protein [Acidimicrobiales bacterium]